MPDLDQLLTADAGGVGRAAAAAAVPPDFGAIVRRGRRRRNVRTGVSVGAAAAALAGIVGMTQVLGGPTPAPPQPAGSSTPTVSITDSAGTTDAADATADVAAVVDHPDARPVGIAVTPGDPDTKAVVWQRGNRWALAVTDDGFVTRTLLAVPPGTDPVPGPEGTFVLTGGWRADSLRIVDVDGRNEAITDRGPVAPVDGGEIAVVQGEPGQDQTVVAVDVAAGTAHPVETPPDLYDLRSYALRLQGLSVADDGRTMVHHWSDDGGATWEVEDLGSEQAFGGIVPSPIGGPRAVIESGDGATLFPFVALHHAQPPGASSRTPFAGPASMTLTSTFFYGDEVRVVGTLWDDSGQEAVDSGTWVVGADGTVEKVVSDTPEVSDRQDVPLICLEYVDGPVVWTAGEDGDVWRSADGGATWERHAAR